MQFDIITIFPEVFTEYFNTSIVGRAQKKKLVKIKTHDLRKFSTDKHKNVDDKPYGGGAGMVLLAEPIIKAVDKIKKTQKSKKHRNHKTRIIIFSAKGKQFTQTMAQNYAKKYDQIIMITGRYEGIDERVKTITHAEEVSIGPYVLTDGELPAMTVVSAVTRLIPGIITQESLNEESFSSNGQRSIVPGLAERSGAGKGQMSTEYPHYTRPEVLKYKGKNYRVPQVLLSGHHAQIKKWRTNKSLSK
jgi:tRNA (guanine37-N1)-methyltransferase